MNSLVGKSTGIALLMAAALLAALFAMGVFSAGSVGADVKGSPAPVVEPTNFRPGAEGVDITITFELTADGIAAIGGSEDVNHDNDGDTDEISMAQDRVEVVLPGSISGGTGFSADDISLKQGTANVGRIIVGENDNDEVVVYISSPETGSSRGDVRGGTTTTLVISNLDVADAPSANENLTIRQMSSVTDQVLTIDDVTRHAITYLPSVTSASVSISPSVAGESSTMTLKFRADSPSEAVANAPASNIVRITLPADYTLGVDPTAANDEDLTLNEDITITASGAPGVTAATVLGDDATPTNHIDVSIFGANAEITVTITGLTNPAASKEISVMFAQGAQEAISRSDYITAGGDLGINDVSLDPVDAGAESELSFSFMALPIGSDQEISISFANGFSVPEQREAVDEDGDPVYVKNVRVFQMDDDDEVALDFTAVYDDPDTDANETLSIAIMDDGDGDDDAGAAIPGQPVYVEISNLTNPDTVGLVAAAITVSQGTHTEASVSIRLTGVQVSSTVAGAAIRLKVSTLAANEIPPGEDIEVKLPGFVLPDTIDEDQVILDGGEGTDRYYGPPSSVTVGSEKVTISIPTSYQNGEPVTDGVPGGNVYTITFKIGAGIKNPTVKRGDRTVTASDAPITETATDVTSKVTAKNAVTPARKENASRGDLVDFSVVGLKTGSATLYLFKGQCVDARQDAAGCVDHNGADVLDADDNPVSDSADWVDEDDDFRIGGGLQVGGKVTVQRRVTSALFEADEDRDGPRELVGTKLRGTNIIYSVDGTGSVSDATGRLAIEPTVDLGTQSIKQGGLLELDISDWHYDDITGIEVGGVPVAERWQGGGPVDWFAEPVGSGGETDFIVVMPPGVRLGEQQLKLIGTTVDEQDPMGAGNYDSFATKIEVDPLDLEVTPVNSDGIPEVVINQEFTIEGRGFNTESGACIQSVKFGDVLFDETTAGVDIDCTSDSLRPDTAGNFSATFRLDPDLAGVRSLKIGEYRVEVKDDEERVGVVDVLIPEPVVEVTPDSSRRGTTVTVVGSKFPASSELAVEIKYGLAGNERTITAATPDSVGSWRETFVIPTTAVIGEDHVVKAAPIDTAFDHYEGKGSHRLPEQEVIVTPSRVAAGGRMRVEGHNMPLFTLVHLKISNITVSGDGFETDGIGSFVKTGVLVPQLQPGIHTVEALVETQGDRAVSVRTSVEVADIVTRPSAEAFDDLISAASLTRVWHLDAATQTWSFFDPAPEFADFNTLTEVSSGQIVTIIMSAPDEFQGRALYVGSNNVAIE